LVAILRIIRSGQHFGADPDEVETQFGAGLMNKIFARFIKDESGATAIEYGLIAALIGVVIISSVKTLGSNLTTTFSKVANNLT
jgi:pilus assembly protein Flp/PilA